MPYIKPEERVQFRDKARELGEQAKDAGQLNYIITEIAHAYIKKMGLRYTSINEVIGILECCKLELYRKVAADYEDMKAQVNGDVGLNEQDSIKPL